MPCALRTDDHQRKAAVSCRRQPQVEHAAAAAAAAAGGGDCAGVAARPAQVAVGAIQDVRLKIELGGREPLLVLPSPVVSP